jgi:hypothetical protein
VLDEGEIWCVSGLTLNPRLTSKGSTLGDSQAARLTICEGI